MGWLNNKFPRLAFLASSRVDPFLRFERLVARLQAQGWAVSHEARALPVPLAALRESIQREQRFTLWVVLQPGHLALYLYGGWGEMWLGRADRLLIRGAIYHSGWLGCNTPQALACSTELLALGAVLYEQTGAALGWMDAEESEGIYDFDDLDACRVEPRHWATFLGPSCLDRGGLSRADGARFHRVVALPDGGRLYVRRPVL